MALTDKLTAIADAIRGKTGGTDPLTLDQMPTEIAGIKTDPVLEPLSVTENGEFTPGEGVDGFDKVTVAVDSSALPEWFAYIKQFNGMFSLLSWHDQFPATVLDLDMRTYFPACESMQSCFVGRHGIEKVIVHSDTLTNVSNMFFNHNTFSDIHLKEIDFSDCVTKNITIWTSFCLGRRGLHTIHGLLDFTSAANIGQMFRYCESLVNIEFAPNTLGVSTDAYTFGNCNALSDVTIVSFANAMKAGTYTLTFPETPKARCAEILGTVSTVTDGDTSYDFFTMDEAGTVTLIEFITTVKGWTLA